jgi:hypothetical protein
LAEGLRFCVVRAMEAIEVMPALLQKTHRYRAAHFGTFRLLSTH